MNFAPVLEALPIVQVHFFTGAIALVLGAVQLAAPKGTLPHRAIGRLWVVLMVVMILASLFIRDRFMWGPFSSNVCWVPSQSQIWMARCGALHVLSVYALLALPYAVLHARNGNIKLHGWTMFSVFFGAVVVAGAFTFQPPRILNAIFFGP
jgi:uncharacterized membrane protein